MAIVIEPGGLGRQYSLNGVAGAAGRGRLLEVRPVVVADSDYTQILGPTPSRAWVIISNRNATPVQIFIGNQVVAYITLGQYGTIQLDSQIPWAGEVLAYQTSGGAVTIDVLEAFVTP